MTPDPLIELYRSAPPDVHERGRAWYPTTRRELWALAQEHDRPLAQVVAVFAIVSVAAQLTTNLRWTKEILRGERKGGRYPNVQGPRVAGALSSDTPEQFVRGPKVNAFYRAILGDPNVVVIDRWAARAAGISSSRHDFGVKMRRQMEEAFRLAAGECDEQVRDFQAIVWLALRESMPIERNGKKFVPKLWDVTHESQISEIGKE